MLPSSIPASTHELPRALQKMLARGDDTATAEPPRRSFLKLAGAGGFALGAFPGLALAQAGGAPAAPGLKPTQQPLAFVQIAKNGEVTVTINRLDFGQGVQTALPMILAEELDADWALVRSRHGSNHPAYADPLWGMHLTGGSTAIKHSYTQYRELGARARAMLLSAAAARWNVDASTLRTQAAGKTARDSFVEGECAVFFSSIADHNTIHKLTPAFGWDVQIIPTYEGVERHNTVVGGASLWVLSGKSDDEYKAAAAYLAFIATKPEQQFLLENSGYIPVTKSTYDALLAEGFYAKEPFINRDIAMKSLTYTEPTELTRGIRLGSFIQIRAEWTAEVEAALAGQKTMKEALDTAVARGNDHLARFAQTYAGKSFP